MRFVIENHRYLMTMIPVLTLFFFAGCGSNDDLNKFKNPLEFSGNFDAKASQPFEELVEIALTTEEIIQEEQRASFETITVRYEVHVVVPKALQTTMEKRVKERRSSILAAVRKEISGCELIALEDPDLTSLKRNLLRALRIELNSDEVRDVVFSQFSLDAC
ncbi:MAG: hypothetical protein VYC98_10465 [Planctomycetota bacterium]|nr:hypothetical protein [Planctomycetota bacterium]